MRSNVIVTVAVISDKARAGYGVCGDIDTVIKSDNDNDRDGDRNDQDR